MCHDFLRISSVFFSRTSSSSLTTLLSTTFSFGTLCLQHFRWNTVVYNIFVWNTVVYNIFIVRLPSATFLSKISSVPSSLNIRNTVYNIFILTPSSCLRTTSTCFTSSFSDTSIFVCSTT